jgi:hypothetical protein
MARATCPLPSARPRQRTVPGCQRCAAMADTPIHHTNALNTNLNSNNHSRVLGEHGRGNLPVVWVMWSPVYGEMWLRGGSSTPARNHQYFSWWLLPGWPRIGAGWLGHSPRPPVNLGAATQARRPFGDHLISLSAAMALDGGQWSRGRSTHIYTR